MVVERTINVGFHSNFGTFKRSRHSLEGFPIALIIHSLEGFPIALIIHSLEGFAIALIIHSLEGFAIALIIHSLDPTRLTIINRFPFNPTYNPKKIIANFGRFPFL